MLAIGAGATTLVLLLRAYPRPPRVLAVPMAIAVGSAAAWTLVSGVTAVVGPSLVALLAAVQVIAAGAFVAAMVWLTLLVTYRPYLLSRSLPVLGAVPPTVTALLLVVPATRGFVLETEGYRVVWGPVLWFQTIASSLGMTVVALLLLVVASTIPGQRPLVLRVMATMVPAAVAWTLFLANGRPPGPAGAGTDGGGGRP